MDSPLCERRAPKEFVELKLSDLPPVEDLQITAPVKSLAKVGKVTSIVDTLVVVEAFRTMPPLDLDTVIFDADGQALGRVFDVFGNVSEPYYSIRFNSAEQITDKKVQKEQIVYILPQVDRKVTRFAFVKELQKSKGTDASGEFDVERQAGDESDEDVNFEG